MRVKDLGKLLIEAAKKESEDSLWERWVRLCPYMEIGQMKFISFDDYKKALIKPIVKLSEKTSEEIVEEMMAVATAYESQRSG